MEDGPAPLTRSYDGPMPTAPQQATQPESLPKPETTLPLLGEDDAACCGGGSCSFG